jgi:hypothetical protein
MIARTRLQGRATSHVGRSRIAPPLSQRSRRQPFEWPIRLNAATVSAVDFHQKVLCSSPHSLHVNSTRTCPWSADTRFGAPHFRHLLSIRVIPCFMVRFLRSKASFTRRSVSSRIACFDISYFLALDAIGHTAARGPRQMNLFCHHDGAVSPPSAMESLHKDKCRGGPTHRRDYLIVLAPQRQYYQPQL